MGTIDAKKAATLSKLIPVMREEWERLGALIEEFDAITGGTATIGEKLKDFEAHYSDLWALRYGSNYVWNYAKDRAQTKRLLKGLSGGELKARASSYIKSDEPFYVNAKHGFGMFVATINQHAGVARSLAEPPTGCKHKPPCKDAAAHTQRWREEMTR